MHREELKPSYNITGQQNRNPYVNISKRSLSLLLYQFNIICIKLAKHKAGNACLTPLSNFCQGKMFVQMYFNPDKFSFSLISAT